MLNNRFENCMNWTRPETVNSTELLTKVSALLAQIEQEGSAKIDELSNQFDDFTPEWITLKPFDEYNLDQSLKTAILQAEKRISDFCNFQKSHLKNKMMEDEAGRFGFKYEAIETIAAYIPGGRFPLISTALMTLIPARIAGCKQRIACSPSDHLAILAAASLAGATRFLKIGGIQAIAAMAYGYNNFTPVQMIVGPGNQYVNTAKQLLQNKVTIDAAAGPSELLIIADPNANLDWLISDMAAQAEHDPQAVSILVSTSRELLNQYLSKIQANSDYKALYEAKQIILLNAQTTEEIVQFSNQYSPEHLLVADDDINIDSLKHYGSLFIGQNSAVAFGDYCSGPNHTLPTIGTANRSSGLSVLSFLKLQSIQQVSDAGLLALAPIAERLAQEEQLIWHKKSVVKRSVLPNRTMSDTL